MAWTIRGLSRNVGIHGWPGSTVQGWKIKGLYGWEPARTGAIIRAHIRLGTHHRAWKMAREVAIAKPGKDNYVEYTPRQIVPGNLAPELLRQNGGEDRSDASQSALRGQRPLRPGAIGCTSGVDGVGIAVAQAQEAWKREKIMDHGRPLSGRRGSFPRRGPRVPLTEDAKHGHR